MTLAGTVVRSMRTEAPGIGSVTWAQSGRLYWLAEMGTEPVAGDEYARREARLVERLRAQLGSSPYGPVTTEPEEASELLARFSGTAVTRVEGARIACRCSELLELHGRAGPAPHGGAPALLIRAH